MFQQTFLSFFTGDHQCGDSSHSDGVDIAAESDDAGTFDLCGKWLDAEADGYRPDFLFFCCPTAAVNPHGSADTGKFPPPQIG